MPDRAVVMVNDVSLIRLDAPTLHTIEVARALAEQGLEVDLVARGPDPQVPGVRFHGGPPYRWNDRRRVPVVNARAARVLWRRRRRAGGLYVREDWSALPAVALGRLLGYRVVLEVNDIGFWPGRDRPVGLRARLIHRGKRRIGIWTWQLSAWIVPVTEGLAGLIADNFDVDRGRIVVLPNGVNADAIVPQDREQAKRAAGLDADRQYVAFVGSIYERVDWQTFVRGFALAAATRPNVTLLVVGDGPEAEGVDRLVEELGLGAQVVRTGFVEDRSRVFDLVGASSVCLAVYKAERQSRLGASPVKLPEYFAAARATVGVDLPGMAETIRESGGGVVVPPGDSEALGAAIGELLDDPERADALGAAGRRAVEERLSWRVIGRQIAELLERDP